MSDMATELMERPTEAMDDLTLAQLAEQANDAARDVDDYASATVEAAVTSRTSNDETKAACL